MSLQVRTHISRSLNRLDAGLGGVAGELHPLRWSTNPEEFTRSVQAGLKLNFLSVFFDLKCIFHAKIQLL
jgi:hypothetical protein